MIPNAQSAVQLFIISATAIAWPIHGAHLAPMPWPDGEDVSMPSDAESVEQLPRVGTKLLLQLGLTPETLAALGVSLENLESALQIVESDGRFNKRLSASSDAVRAAAIELQTLETAMQSGRIDPDARQLASARDRITAARVRSDSVRLAIVGELLPSRISPGRLARQLSKAHSLCRIPAQYRLDADAEQLQQIRADLQEAWHANRNGSTPTTGCRYRMGTTHNDPEYQAAQVALTQNLIAIRVKMRI